MPLTLIKEDGTGKVDANSYASAADGDAYHDGHLYASAWTAATTPNKEKALVMATRLIDGEYQFNGFKRSDAQALQWPRERCDDLDRSGVGIGGGGVAVRVHLAGAVFLNEREGHLLRSFRRHSRNRRADDLQAERGQRVLALGRPRLIGPIDVLAPR